MAHKRQIERILADIPGAECKRFWKRHEELCKSLGMDSCRFSFEPDAFWFDTATFTINLYEVEVSSPLMARKISLLGDFWDWWECEGESDWLPCLIVVDRFGNRNEMDLKHAFYGTGWAQDIAGLTPESIA